MTNQIANPYEPPATDSKLEPVTQVFRCSVSRLLFGYVGLFAVFFVIAHLMRYQGPIPYVAIAAKTAIGALVGTAITWAYVKVEVTDKTLRTTDKWGRYLTVEWANISRVKPFNSVPVAFLRIYSDKSPIWLSLFLSNSRAFWDFVSTKLPEEHPLVQYRLKKDTGARPASHFTRAGPEFKKT